ncbi:MAG: hypothetical protein K6G01_10415 [Eubacterium sp.]|nr:hypothetical protein [Eubacterium sp.]
MRRTVKRFLATIALVLAVSIVAPAAFHAVADPVNVEAATTKTSKKTIYYGELLGTDANERGYEIPSISKFSTTKTTVTIKGSLMRNGNYNNITANKTHTFKIAKKCKYYTWGYDGEKKISKKKFMKLVKCYNGLGVSVYTNKSGKVYRMDISS